MANEGRDLTVMQRCNQPMSEALADRLRRLSTVLPPNFRVASGEVGDVLSALIAFTEHGDPLLEAVDAGAQAVADLFHKYISDNRPDGADEPQRGAPVENVPTTVAGQPAPAGGVSQQDFAQLVAAVGQLTQLVQQQQRTDTPAPTQPADEPAPEAAHPGPAPSPAPVDPPPAGPTDPPPPEA